MKPFNEHDSAVWDFTNTQALHGDVILERVGVLPNDFDKMKKEPNDALAYGESTGHLHKLFQHRDPELLGAVSFDLRIDNDGIKWLKVIEPTILKHQEHSPRVIPAGLYKIGIQREYDPFTKRARQVAD